MTEREDGVPEKPTKPRKRSPLAAIRPGPEPHGDWRDRLLYKPGRNGSPRIDDCAANAITILRCDPEWAGVLAFDELAQAIVSRREPPWHELDAPAVVRPGPMTDSDAARTQAWLRRRYSITIGVEATWQAIAVVAESASFNPVREWMDPLAWDGTPRLGFDDPTGGSWPSWLSTYFGAPNTRYVRHVGRWFLISAVARVYDPGCKVDTVPVLEGLQGKRKGRALRLLFGSPWYSDTPLDLASKDRFVSLSGVWGYELAEFDQYGRHEANVLKAFASSQVDKFRPPFGRTDLRAPRRCVFVATINPGKEYLADETGGRRWWPVSVAEEQTIDLEGLERDRDQIWAEARDAYLEGAALGDGRPALTRWWPVGPEEELCRDEQAQREVRDAWEDRIATWLGARAMGSTTTVGDVLLGAFSLDPSRWSETDQRRAARALRRLGWQSRRDAQPHALTRQRGYHYILTR